MKSKVVMALEEYDEIMDYERRLESVSDDLTEKIDYLKKKIAEIEDEKNQLKVGLMESNFLDFALDRNDYTLKEVTEKFTLFVNVGLMKKLGITDDDLKHYSAYRYNEWKKNKDKGGDENPTVENDNEDNQGD